MSAVGSLSGTSSSSMPPRPARPRSARPGVPVRRNVFACLRYTSRQAFGSGRARQRGPIVSAAPISRRYSSISSGFRSRARGASCTQKAGDARLRQRQRVAQRRLRRERRGQSLRLARDPDHRARHPLRANTGLERGKRHPARHVDADRRPRARRARRREDPGVVRRRRPGKQKQAVAAASRRRIRPDSARPAPPAPRAARASGPCPSRFVPTSPGSRGPGARPRCCDTPARDRTRSPRPGPPW